MISKEGVLSGKSDTALRLLNDAFHLDSKAMEALVKFRVPCNLSLAGHPTIQVVAHPKDGKNPNVPEGSEYGIGILGILNGILGYQNSKDLVAAQFGEESGKLVGFQVYTEKSPEASVKIEEHPKDLPCKPAPDPSSEMP
jgi:hypothetical protein